MTSDSRPRQNIPVLLDFRATIDWCVDCDYAPDADELVTACSRVGRIDAVSLVLGLHSYGLLTEEAAVANVGSVWSMSEWPDQQASHEDWDELFAFTGYTVDGQRATRPTEPLTLFRGVRARASR